MKKTVFLILLFSSCKNNYDAFEKKLISNDNCWRYFNDVINLNNIDTVYVTCIKFTADNTYQIFLLKNKKLEIIESIEGGSGYRGEWKYSASDSTFKLGYNTFKVKSSVGDTIILLSNSNSKHLLVKAQTHWGGSFIKSIIYYPQNLDS